MSGWTCRARTANVYCGRQNPPRAKKCWTCGKPRPKKRQRLHAWARDIPYERYVEVFGERCGICGRTPTELGRRLCRDHGHTKDGKPRGLLCVRDNLMLDGRFTVEWLRQAADYLERAERVSLVRDESQQ